MKDVIVGLAVASDEQIEACILYVAATAEIVFVRSFIDGAGSRLPLLLSRLSARDPRVFRFPKVHPAEASKELLETCGFRPAGGHQLYATRARSE